MSTSVSGPTWRRVSLRAVSLSLGAASLCLALLALPAAAATGGPDSFGYTWKDGGEPDLDYAWQAPGGGAMDVTVLGDDTTTGFLALSFPFPYYGTSYTQVAVCSNGWLSLVDDVSTTFTNLTIPTVGEPQGVIAAWWNDLELSNRTSQVLFEDLGTHAVVTWDQAHDRGDSRARNTFQVILHDDGRIVVQLDELGGDTTGASLGIESPDESTGLQVFRNPAGGITAPHVVEFSPPAIVGTDLDCTGARPLACGDAGAGDRLSGASNQSTYGCPTGAMDGREEVWTIDVAGPNDVRLVLDDDTGAAQIVVLDGCNPNRCLAPPGTVVELDNFDGPAVVVVDGPAGLEGGYRIFMDCFPVPGRIDCAGASPLACGDVLSADLGTGSADQSRYWCTPEDLGGREHVYRIDLAELSDVRIDLTPISGDPRLLLLNPCDPSFCTDPVGNTLQLDDAIGEYHVVVDCPPGQEGAYQIKATCLQEEFTFCGDGTYDSQAGRDPNGSWTVPGMLYDGTDTHSWAMRVDGGTIYTQDETCIPFPLTSAGSLGDNGPGLITWDAEEGRLDVTVSQLQAASCCGLLVTAEITNTDDVPHSYDLRVLHDIAFGLGDGTCTLDVVNGGPIVIDGTTHTRETELLPLGADACDRPIELYSAEDPATLVGSFEMFGDNLPNDMEFVSWENAFDPCAAWSDVSTGSNLGDCFGDSALLLTWQFPAGGGTLAPGESATAGWRIGKGCTFDCTAPCEDPIFLGPVSSTDEDPCLEGLLVEWEPADFPDAGNGVYHVYSSPVSVQDALLRPPITPVGGVTGLSFLDTGAALGVETYHVVMAESTDLAGCGDGPAASGSTAWVGTGPSADDAAALPVLSTATAVDVDGCLGDIGLEWLPADFPDGTGVYHVYRSTLSFADALLQAPLTPAAGIDALSWLDAAPPANQDLYYVLLAEGTDRPGCGDGPSVLGPTDLVEIGPVTDAVAEDPVLGAGLAMDPSGCTQGLELSWDAATAPGASVIRYHLYRSAVSHDDALLQAALTPPEGILETTWSDAGSPLDVPLFYVLLAEAVELPGCGDGPSFEGTTDRLDFAELTDLGAEAPLLSNASGQDDDGCAAGLSLSWDEVAWPSPADGGVYHVHRSTLSFADALASAPATGPSGLAMPGWTDFAAPANVPLYYVVQAESFERPGCGDGPVMSGLTHALEVDPLTDSVTGDVVVGAGAAMDDDACALGGIFVTWEAAAFPGPGNGRYHVYRSELSAADALSQPPISAIGGIVGTGFFDAAVVPGTEYFYAVVAESTDFPGCSDGPSVGGPNASLDCGSAIDAADTIPPIVEVGGLLRLSAGTRDSVTLDWAGAPMPPVGEDWAVLRSNGDASPGAFAVETRRSVTTWTDAASAAPGGSTHVWFYDVRVADDCFLSED